LADADKICGWLGIECLEPSYYRDVYVMDAGRADPTREFPPTAGEATTTLPFRGGTSATHKAHAAAAVKEAAVASAQAAGFEVVADEADAAAEAEAGEEEEVNQVCCGSGCVGAFVVCVWTFVEPP
jgi:hypothetical protein